MDRALIVRSENSKKDLLVFHGKIIKVGNIKKSSLEDLEIPVEEIDAGDGYIIPGLIDPHQHIIGGSGECSYCSKTPEMTLPEIVSAGITTVVGCLGVDAYMRNMPALLAQAKAFKEEGITAYIYTGGYDIPVQSLTGSVYKDMILIPEVIGAGEIAISDVRSSSPSIRELAKLVSASYNGGLMSGKSGVTHFHVGDGKYFLQPLIDLLDQYDIKKTSVYPTHMSRNPTLLKQASQMSRQGIMMDFDCESEDLVPSIADFVKHEGDLNYLTVSSDASHNSPATLFQQMTAVMQELKWDLEKILPLSTSNVARILGLKTKGKLALGYDADIVVLNKNLTIRHVIAGGKIFIRESKFVAQLMSLIKSNRRIELYGAKTN